MKDKIIGSAGKIWNLLGDKGLVAVSQLPDLLDEKGEVTYQALGWLAREDKIEYVRKGLRMCVQLVEAEQQAYKFCKESSLV